MSYLGQIWCWKANFWLRWKLRSNPVQWTHNCMQTSHSRGLSLRTWMFGQAPNVHQHATVRASDNVYGNMAQVKAGYIWPCSIITTSNRWDKLTVDLNWGSSFWFGWGKQLNKDSLHSCAENLCTAVRRIFAQLCGKPSHTRFSGFESVVHKSSLLHQIGEIDSHLTSN